MDAVKYLKEKGKMTEGCASDEKCRLCPLSERNNEEGLPCYEYEFEHPEESVEIVEKWAAEHPAKTRQTEFLEIFPYAKMEGGAVQVNPCTVDTKNIPCNGTMCNKYDVCNECRRDYWLAEVD